MPASSANIEESLDLLDVGVGLFDRDLRLEYCNPAFRNMRRYREDLCRPGGTLEALLRFNAERGDFGPGDIDAQVAERLAEIGERAERTLEREMADGQVLAIRYCRTASGKLLVTYRDVTAERRAERALRDSEERYALVSEAAEELIYDWHITERKFFASPRLQAFLGRAWGADGVRGWDWEDLIHPDDLPHYRERLAAHISGAEPRWLCEYRLSNAEGEWRWVSDHGTSVRDAGERAVRLVAAIRDITEMRETRAEVERVESRLQGAIETIADGILLVDPGNRVELFNTRYVEIFSEAAGGADLSGLVVKGRDFFEMIRAGYEMGMFKPHPDGADGWIAARRRAWEQPVANWELELANGRWILLNERRMPDGGRVSVYTDITELKRREDEAQAARQRFEDAIEAISSGFALWDADDRLVISNSRYREYFLDLADVVVPGAAFSDIIRTGLARGLFPLSDGNVEAYLREIAEKRLKAIGEIREQLIGGVWLQITDHRTADGGIVSIYTDVSELKTKQLEIEKQTAILELTMENMGQGITLVDKDLRTIALNRKFLELMEFPVDRFRRGFSMEEAFRFNAERGEYGPGDVEEQVRERLELAAKFLPHRFERTRPDGTVIEIVGNPIESGGFVSTYTDVTERKRADEALKTALAEFNAVLDSADYGVLFMDRDLRARIVNRAFGRIWNIPQDFIDRRPTMRELIEYNRDTGIYAVALEDWDDWVDRRLRAIRKGDFPSGELVRADGIVLRYECVSLPDGGRMLTYFDITELKQREAEIARARDAAEAALADLRRAQERLIQSEKMASLGHLTAGIAHEIKNPLNFVNNFAKLSDELLGELGEVLEAPIAALPDDEREDAEDLLKTVRENLAKINHHGRRADSIVKNMLLHSREGPSERQTVALNPIAEEALNLAYHGARAEDPTFNIEMAISTDPEVGQIECYPQDLMRVFLNLITNGMYAANKRKALEGDGFAPRISVTTRAEGDAVAVEVLDNGVGIPPEVREKIFLPFFTTKPAGEGTGLGLSLSYDIVVKQHGGALTVESEPERHTRFLVAIPRRAAPAGGAR